jgi:hypothetical protein
MDNWTDGCYIHDVWEEHFECGVWLADYSSPLVYSDDMLIYNCRIRNNLADGVNFCQGTSNSTVYNCSIRNNGDDGLALWSNNYLSAKNETGNVFCYNTIDLIWRAGSIAVYGGTGHQIYNNYISDTFMASGIHLNTNFGGYKFTDNTGISFDNNVLVNAGTISDSWNSNMGAIDIYGDVKNITFNNTYIYNAQHNGVRLYDSLSKIVFNNLNIYGTGIDGNTIDNGDNGAAIRYEALNTTKSITYNGLVYANIPYSGILYGSRILSTFTNESNLGNNYAVAIPTGRNKIVTSPLNISSNVTENVTENATVMATKIKLAKRKKSNKIRVVLKKIKSVQGYQIQICKNKKFKKNLINKKVTKAITVLKVKKLKKIKKVYIRARAYKKINGKLEYSAWSKIVKK